MKFQLIVFSVLNITANVLGLCEGRASEYKSSNLAQCLIAAQMFNKPLMPCFCKTLVTGRCGLISKQFSI
jgi:hypothetical protein